MKMGDSCDVPRVAGHGTRKESAGVAGEVGDDQFYEFLRKPGDLGRAQDRNLRGISKEKLLNFGYAPPPDHGNDQFGPYDGRNTTR